MGIFALLVFGPTAWGLWKLLHLQSKPIEHFVCFVHRSSYPPHSEDWVITHQIRVFRGLLWTLFVLNALVMFFFFVTGIAAMGGVMFGH